MTVIETIRRYKYLPFNQGSLRTITDGTIKFTSPSKVNDPFDCAPDIETRNIAEYLNTRPDLLEGAGDLQGLSEVQRIRDKSKMIRRLKKAAVQGAFGQKAVDDVGICSLSRDPLNLLMWAHYAQYHSGFVVEFDIPISATDVDKDRLPSNWLFEWLIPQVVEYQKLKPIVDFFDDKDEKTRKQFLVKGEGWKYEQEERVIDFVRGHGIHKYDRGTVLYSVIAGMKMDGLNYVTLVECVNKMNQELNLEIQVYKTEPVKGEFELFVPNRTDLAPCDSGESVHNPSSARPAVR